MERTVPFCDPESEIELNMMKMKSGVLCIMCILLCTSCSSADEQEDTKKAADPQILVSIKDLSSPIINCADRLVFQQDETIDVDRFISVMDNYDASIEYQLLDFPKLDEQDHLQPGEYQFRIRAVDASGNAANKTITLVVEEKKVVDQDKQNSGQQESSGSHASESKPVSPVTKSSRSFLFSEGYDRNTAFQACTAYISGSNMMCRPLMNEDASLYIGYEAIPY